MDLSAPCNGKPDHRQCKLRSTTTAPGLLVREIFVKKCSSLHVIAVRDKLACYAVIHKKNDKKECLHDARWIRRYFTM